MSPADEAPTACSPDSAPGSGSASTPGAELTVRTRRRPIPRKGHTKSRRGCINCKRRKVKCPETLPECDNCTRIGLACEYSDRRPRASSKDLLSLTCSPSASLQSTPTLFTGNDMLFFHHFLITAYPGLPIRGDDIWRNVAALSHTYDYLMHAMLGTAASHLTIYGGDFTSQALAHRIKAIQLLNKCLSAPPTSTAEGDARFAAMLALTFQASCMPEGMTEFLAMVKGCHILAKTSLLACPDSLFRRFTLDGHSVSVRNVSGTTSVPVEPEQEALLDDFLVSLRALAPLCRSSLEVRFLASIERVVELAKKKSAAEGFAEFSTPYSLIAHAPYGEYSAFVNPKHYPAQLLIIHFVLVEFAIGYLALGPVVWRFAHREKSCIAWTERLAADLPEELKAYVEWPMRYVKTELAG